MYNWFTLMYTWNLHNINSTPIKIMKKKNKKQPQFLLPSQGSSSHYLQQFDLNIPIISYSP